MYHFRFEATPPHPLVFRVFFWIVLRELSVVPGDRTGFDGMKDKYLTHCNLSPALCVIFDSSMVIIQQLIELKMCAMNDYNLKKIKIFLAFQSPSNLIHIFLLQSLEVTNLLTSYYSHLFWSIFEFLKIVQLQIQLLLYYSTVFDYSMLKFKW